MNDTLLHLANLKIQVYYKYNLYNEKKKQAYSLLVK